VRIFRRKKRHVHSWSEWRLGTINGMFARTGVKVSWDIQQRICKECGYAEREDL
jgi:hypothetical protein